MLEHIKIFGFVGILMLGVIAVAYIWHMYKKYPEDYLLSLIKYVLVTNVAFVVMFVYHYAAENIPTEYFNPQNVYVDNISKILTNAIGILSVYYIISIVLTFKGISVTRGYKTGVWLLILVLSLGLLSGVFFQHSESILILLAVFNRYIVGNYVLVEILALIAGLFFWRRTGKGEHKKLSIYFSILYLLGYFVMFSLYLLAAIFKLGVAARVMVGMILIAYFNIVPLIWAQYIFLPYATSVKKIISNNLNMQSIYDRYHITKREGEIIALILDGKSNRQIQDKLFISFHTVKNHVSNIYRKLDVKSRHDLLRFFMLESHKYN